MTKAFEPRIPRPPGMPHLVHRTAELQNLGWSVADAEWLALVCLYSGVFTRHQYRGWHHRDKHAASRFVQRLTAAGVAREHSLPERCTPERFCHVFGRSLCRALGIEHAHQRRLGSTALLWRRLLTLDCLLAYPDGNWLATGSEKLQYFLDHGYDEEDLPQRLLGDRALWNAKIADLRSARGPQGRKACNAARPCSSAAEPQPAGTGRSPYPRYNCFGRAIFCSGSCSISCHWASQPDIRGTAKSTGKSPTGKPSAS